METAMSNKSKADTDIIQWSNEEYEDKLSRS